MRNHLALGLALSAVSSFAAAIDTWEPVKTGDVIPSAAASSPTYTNNWIGYTNGDIYWGSNANWVQVNFNGPSNTTPVRPGLILTSIAANKGPSNDWALVSYANSGFGPSAAFALWEVFLTHNGPTMTDLTSKVPAGTLFSTSASPLDNQLFYIATNQGAFAAYRDTWTFVKKQPNDPLQVPTGSAISAVTRRPDADQILVGTETGEVWVVFGAIAGTPSWTRLDNGPYTVLPKNQVTKLDFDVRDVSGKTFVVSLDNYGNSAWITRNGGQSWTAVDAGPYNKGPGSMRNVTFARAAGATTLYGYAFGGYGVPYSARSDDNGKSWFTTTRWSGKNLSVEYKHYDNSPYGNQLFPLVRVRNNGSIPVVLTNAVFDYTFTPEGTSPPVYYCDWSPYGCNAVKGVFPSTYNLQIQLNTSITVGADQASGEIQGRVAKSDWSNYDQTNDLSYIPAAAAFTVNHRIKLSNNGQYLWGY